ncbi:MAG: DUF6431 domain-containing protein [Lachnospiraceae bacterium]|nr:DUF6431 domain-containing protein [Lachnospiraceae bacterium]
MIIISEYDFEQKPDTNFFYVRSRTASSCPFCSGKLKPIGSRHRKLRQHDGSGIILIIRRLRCLKCLCVHHELPDRIVPYKRYDAETVEQVITTVGASSGTGTQQPDYPCEFSTALRLFKWFLRVLSHLCEISKNLHQDLLHLFQIDPISPESFINLPPGWLKKVVSFREGYTCNA